MAIIKMKKIIEMSEKELADTMNELKLELSKERGMSEIGTTKSPGRIRAIRKSIARINTVKNNTKNVSDNKAFDNKIAVAKKDTEEGHATSDVKKKNKGD